MPNSKWLVVVDDDPREKEAVLKIIKADHSEVKIVEAVDGRDAILRMRNQQFDLLVAGFRMAHGDAAYLLNELQALDRSIRPRQVLILSETEPPITLSESVRFAYLPRPLQPDQFKKILGERLSGGTGANPTGRAEPKIDVSFINPFIEATLQVLSTTAKVTPVRDNVFIRKNEQISGDISAVIAMNSDRYLGSMAISFEEECFLGIVEGMLGEKYSEITPDIQDAAAEICNQVFGVAKKTLNEKGHTIRQAIPSVITGRGHTIRHPIAGLCVAIRFKTPPGTFVVETVVQISGEH